MQANQSQPHWETGLDALEIQLSGRRIVQSLAEMKRLELSRCSRGCYIHSDDCAGHVTPLAMDRPCLGPYPAAAARDDRL